jgi:flavin reductase (DIM6/NTAB) family NADH-FMN oxidoreductase RutF
MVAPGYAEWQMNQHIVELFRRLTLGVYVVGVAHASDRDAFTAAAVLQASYKPLLLAIAVNPEHASYSILQAGRVFAVSVLADNQMELARRFGTTPAPGTDKMNGVAWRIGGQGAPILGEALAFFECVVQAEMPAGDHRIVLGRVVDGAVITSQRSPLVYADTRNLDDSASLYPASF